MFPIMLYCACSFSIQLLLSRFVPWTRHPSLATTIPRYSSSQLCMVDRTTSHVWVDRKCRHAIRWSTWAGECFRTVKGNHPVLFLARLTGWARRVSAVISTSPMTVKHVSYKGCFFALIPVLKWKVSRHSPAIIKMKSRARSVARMSVIHELGALSFDHVNGRG